MSKPEITIVASNITEEIIQWYFEVGGRVNKDSWYNMRGQEVSIPIVAYGGGRASHRMQNDSGQYLIRFLGEDADIALIFLMKFSKYVVSHNMKEQKSYAY
jgi:hypothetical protein